MRFFSWGDEMNNKIKEFADQAGIFSGQQVSMDSLERFAKLIRADDRKSMKPVAIIGMVNKAFFKEVCERSIGNSDTLLYTRGE